MARLERPPDVVPERSPDRPPERVVVIRPRTVLMVIATALAVAFTFALVYLAWQVITWILIALFLSLALNPAVAFFERRGMRRSLAAGLVFLLAVAAVAGLATAFIPPLVRNLVDFIEAVPDLIEDLSRGRGPLGFLEERYNVVDRVRDSIEERGAERILGLGAPAVDIAQRVVVTAVGIVAVVFLTFFMLLEGPRWIQRFLETLPERSRPRWERIGHGVYRSIGGWVTGALLVSLIAGIAATIVLLVLGVDFAFALGLLVAVLGLVPLAGATIAAIILAAVAFATEGVVDGIIVVVYFVVYQQVENHIIFPLVYGRMVQVSPLTVLVAVLIGAQIAGIIGALVAIPIAASLQVIAGEIHTWRREQAIETGGLGRVPRG